MKALPSRKPGKLARRTRSRNVEPDYGFAVLATALGFVGWLSLGYPLAALFVFACAALAAGRFLTSTAPISDAEAQRRARDRATRQLDSDRYMALSSASERAWDPEDLRGAMPGSRLLGTLTTIDGIARGNMGEIALGQTISQRADIADIEAAMPVGTGEQQLQALLITLGTDCLERQIIVSRDAGSMFHRTVFGVQPTSPLRGKIFVAYKNQKHEYNVRHSPREGYWFVEE